MKLTLQLVVVVRYYHRAWVACVSSLRQANVNLLLEFIKISKDLKAKS